MFEDFIFFEKLCSACYLDNMFPILFYLGKVLSHKFPKYQNILISLKNRISVLWLLLLSSGTDAT